MKIKNEKGEIEVVGKRLRYCSSKCQYFHPNSQGCYCKDSVNGDPLRLNFNIYKFHRTDACLRDFPEEK